MSKEIGLREIKVARLKLRLLELTLESISPGRMDELHVEQLCKKAETSKVTFFKYFPRKEDLLVYFMRIWSFQRAVELKSETFRGRATLEYLFRKAAEDNKNTGIMLSLVGFIARLSEPPPPYELTPAERSLLYPQEDELWEQRIPGLNEMLQVALKEAHELKEIAPGTDRDALLLQLNTLFYGAPLTAHMTGQKNLAKLYSEHLEALFAANQ